MQEIVITPELVSSWYRERKPDSHKGDYGRALLVAGSRGMMGAALLSARACMRGGVGLLTVRVPACGYEIMQLGLPEAKCDCDASADHHTHIQLPPLTEVIGIGPGLGQHPDTQQALLTFLQQQPLPMVLDADALNILSHHPECLGLLATGTILTPHPGEMQRLGLPPQELANRYGLIIVLKGHHTRIYFSKEVAEKTEQLHEPQYESAGCFVNTLHGNAGMAVGGSGDVLTGIILALLAQHYAPLQAAVIGVWLHAHAADLALADHNSMESLLPSDIITHLGQAWSSIR